ncbi:uncharacterized protein PHALS_14822 [Plasmopara halstedii]|uniref:Uncharacterized protein n=1 Tax=Plasmopara halstedii TaxID=4781 RepID=A0A0P1AXP2_PLAHL|nr:uncharacterized protein PHALS_14822 [Plasmopara halstedii]CEG45572.1 hypothetical protein PHALS_14822 [Plasmopara halstedii]|eukprot:XP_024581941.1 hypothetical protein PHALS_14822 [Plasmopara halstedii]
MHDESDGANGDKLAAGAESTAIVDGKSDGETARRHDAADGRHARRNYESACESRRAQGISNERDVESVE